MTQLTGETPPQVGRAGLRGGPRPPPSWGPTAPAPVRRDQGEDGSSAGHGPGLQGWTDELLARLPRATPQERHLIRDEVVTAHLWLADRAARRYGLSGQRDDLVQVARIGLVEAFDRYDATRGTYPGFAWTTMTGLLRHHLRDQGWSVRPPRSASEAAGTLRAAVPDLAQVLGRTPTTADLASYLGWTPGAVGAARTAELGRQAASVEAMPGEAWMPARPSESDAVELRVVLARVVQDLGPRERDLVRMRFVEELTQSEMAARIGVTQMQVSRLLAQLMTTLRARIAEPHDHQERVAARRPPRSGTPLRGHRGFPAEPGLGPG